MKLCLLSLVILSACCHFGNGLRILSIFPLNGKSHWVMGERLLSSLAERGHQVDVVSHFPLKKPMPNYKDISLDGSLEPVVNNMHWNKTSQFNKRNFSLLIEMAGLKTCDLLELEQLQNLIKNPPKDKPYDLVIVEIFMAPCYIAFGRHLNVPVVGVMTAFFYDWLGPVAGNPQSPAYLPQMFTSFSNKMNFWERLANTFFTNFITQNINSLCEKMAGHVKKHFGIDTSIEDLYKDIALYLVNSHHSINGVRPMSTGIIEVGGLHVSENGDPLSPEVQKWMDEAKHGVVYVAFGSMVRFETTPKSTVQAFYKVFEKIAPTRVLLKVAKKEDLLPGLPKNVMVQSWFPQVTVFKHKNLKAFITHGGLMSLQEAIYFGVPLVGIPLFGDQHINMKNAVAKNIAISLGSMQNVSYETLSYAVDKVLNDEVYRGNVKKVSDLFKDRPMKPVDTAIYWIEYVGRHGKILQSPALHLSWYQQELLDVYGFVVVCLLAVLLVVVIVVRKLMKLLLGCKSCSSKNAKTSESKKRK